MPRNKKSINRTKNIFFKSLLLTLTKLVTLIWLGLARALAFIKKQVFNLYRKTTKIVIHRPMGSFFSLLAILFILILISHFLSQPPAAPKAQIEAKTVSVYRIGIAPKLELQGQVEKTGVVQIMSLMSGVVQTINVKEGQSVKKGQSLITMVTNYQGGNVFTLQRQMAEKQNQITQDNYQTQKNLIARQRDIADQTETNFEEMRDLNNQSIDATQTIIHNNSDITDSLNAQVQSLQASPSADPNAILGLKELLSQYSSANLQLNNALRQAQYQVDPNNPPSSLTRLQHDMTLAQIDIQEKALDLGKDISSLQLQLARVNEASMLPSAPFDGTVERIYVRPGQSIGGNTPLLTLTAKGDTTLTVNVYVSKDIRDKVSNLETSTIQINGQAIEVYPFYISREAVQGNLYDVIYQIPQDSNDSTTDKSYVTVQVPVGLPNTNGVIPFVPLDSVYQTQSNAFVNVVENGNAASRQVSLGPVFGRYVQINSGLGDGDQIILDRNVITGDPVSVSQ
jgi:multidrug efflux pump subunit AcrA (membrane-fusion protein)